MQATRSEVLTVGHSTREPGELEKLLVAHGVKLVVDVRAQPGSRRMPHFGCEALERSLSEAGIGYLHLPELGGRRRPHDDSPNGAWQNAQFQGYADHTATDEFERGLARTTTAASARRTVLMCAEAAWWRCHRRLIADVLTARGWAVLHVTGSGRPSRHELPDFAVVDGGRVVYPPPQESLEL
jgi:uncharacterized protein (DUF488 family)